MKLLSTLVLTAFVVTLFTSAALAKKNSNSSNSERQSSSSTNSSCNCNESLPMTALDCCNMPQFMSQVMITGCRVEAMKKLSNSNKQRKGPMDGPPEEFFECLLRESNCGTEKKGKLEIDEKKTLDFLQGQLNDTTKKDWTKPVSDANAACIKVYKKSNNYKDFYDCTVKELYVNCPKFNKDGDCPKYQNYAKKCPALKLQYRQGNGNGAQGNGPRGPRGNGNGPRGNAYGTTNRPTGANTNRAK